MNSKKHLAKVTLMMSYIERCYTEEVPNKYLDEILALEIYRILTLNKKHSLKAS